MSEVDEKLDAVVVEGYSKVDRIHDGDDAEEEFEDFGSPPDEVPALPVFEEITAEEHISSA